MTQKNKHLFPLGQIVATPGAIEALQTAGQNFLVFLHRHQTGDWSEMVAEDQAANQQAVEHDTRVFSSYKLRNNQKLWVITEWDRSVTTLLLPQEY